MTILSGSEHLLTKHRVRELTSSQLRSLMTDDMLNIRTLDIDARLTLCVRLHKRTIKPGRGEPEDNPLANIY